MTVGLTVLPVAGLPEFSTGDDLAGAVAAVFELHDGDVVVVSQKVVSKVEGAVVDPPDGGADGNPRRALARTEAVEVVADAPWALIVRTRHGFVCANAGIDASNVPGGKLALLPDDPDASARRLRERLLAVTGADVAVVVADTFGRPWRVGQTDVAIGVAGLEPLHDERGSADRDGSILSATQVAVADELAGAADLVRTKAAGIPVVVVRGFALQRASLATAGMLVRDADSDLFRRGAGMLAAALTDQAWPARWAAGVSSDDVAAARRVAPDLTVEADTSPATLLTSDRLGAGLAAAVLTDRGLRVRWHVDGPHVRLEAGRPLSPR